MWALVASPSFSGSLRGVVDKSLGVGWGEETLFLLPRRSRRSTPISSPPPISTPPTDSPPNQQPKQPTTQPTKQPTPPSPLTPPKDAASAHKGVERKGVRRGLGMGSPIF
ncbi:hypothetical protein PGTUg99_031007 [Puccinia graminis f. sp. tritici]|uniref:Uncharacterized protein n=1 Tax=Puccinia graminis f. sp. tritici TaxID=56615 RepID=A0A5B0RM78_PUCGR|nr:hypothetical protein PGTUg99_031007 [Puccinia graminis f. sp. tritici]